MPGPLPKPAGERRRRNATVAMTQLPAEGRCGPTPDWPLPPLILDEPELVEILEAREAELWAELWSTPQAVAWERLKWTRTVARYVRFEVRAETGDLKAGAESRLLEDRLGLSPQAMLRLRWEVSADEVAEQRAERSARPAKRTARQRLKVVDGDAVAGT
ncbi:hypothetical protein AB0K71_05775 [Streptomyces syringium]|uniref:phage terminase small subunit n=1 Tax=Streptomyces syringium TaxID=76729 RepID=UPI0034217EB6